MQDLEIKDVQSGAVYRIASQGSVIGREGAKADIIIKNPSVSKRHARIYATDGQWFLEDLGSSNGTFFANQRINEPVPLGPGTLFALAEIQFEVVKKAGANGEERGGRGDRAERDRLRAATAARPDDGEVIGGPTARPSPAAREAREAFGATGAGGGGDDDEMATGVGAIMSALPRAFAHYLVLIPKLAVNPIGTVRNSVEDQHHPAMSWWSLAGWGIPPMLLSAAVAVLVSIIAMLVGGTFLVGALVGVIITPAIMIGVALVMALIWHPVLEWVIRKLKGHSDARSRSNYFVIVMTSMALTQIVTGVAGLFALVPVPFIGIAPLVLSIIASLISLYVSYVWVRYFEMHKIVPILVLVGMALTAVSGLLGIVGVVSSGGAAMMAAGGSGGSAGTAATDEATAKAIADATAAAAAAGNLTPEAAKALADAAETQRMADEKVRAALEGAGKAGAAAGADAAKLAEAAKANAEAEKARAEAAALEAGKDAKVKAEVEKMKAEELARAKEEADRLKNASAKAQADAQLIAAAAAEKAKDEAAAKAGGDVEEAAARPNSAGYVAWAAKRDAVEKAITDDPTLLRKKDVLALYERYTRDAFEIKKSYASKRSAKEPWRDRIIDRQIAAETFDKTKNVIEELHSKIF